MRTPAPPSLATTDPAEILAIVRTREDDVRSLRATFETSTRQDEKLVRTIDGVLLVRKPDAFRLRLSTPLGLTAFDYLSRADGVRVVSPFAAHGADASYLPFSEDDLREIFIRGDRAFPGACAGTLARLDELVVDCRAPSGELLRTILIDTHAGTIREERSYRGGKLHLLLRNEDYRPTASTNLPYRILLTYPSTHTAVEIVVHRYEVNPALEDRLFAPVSG